MIETKEKEIAGSVYSVTQMTARRALRMQAKLLKIIGSPLAEMTVFANKNPGKEDECLSKCVGLLADNLDDKTFDEFIVELLNGVRKDGSELTSSKIDLEFAGKLATLFQVVKFVIEVNFSDFFSEGGILSLVQNR